MKRKYDPLGVIGEIAIWKQTLMLVDFVTDVKIIHMKPNEDGERRFFIELIYESPKRRHSISDIRSSLYYGWIETLVDLFLSGFAEEDFLNERRQIIRGRLNPLSKVVTVLIDDEIYEHVVRTKSDHPAYLVKIIMIGSTLHAYIDRGSNFEFQLDMLCSIVERLARC